MNRNGHKGRTDGNHQAVIKALREAGMSAISLASVGDGCGDVLVGFRGANFLLEVKDGSKPPSARALSSAEKDFHGTWSGQIDIVNSGEEAITAVTMAAKALLLI